MVSTTVASRPVGDPPDREKGQYRSAALTIALCFSVALLEGLDIQAPGIAAPRLVPEFGLSPGQAGWFFSSSVLGLLFGAAYGGWLADRIGRKRVLIVSVVVFGLFTLATALAWNVETLLLARFLTGLGLGGALPNLIALSAEAGPPRIRTTLVTLMYSGVPLGGALAGTIGLMAGDAADWRVLFYVGGLGPLIVAPLLAYALPESEMFRRAQVERASALAATPKLGVARTLFGRGRLATTLLVWISFIGTLLVLYLLLNWLPLLLVDKGFTRPQATLLAIIFNLGAAMGAVVLGLLMDRTSPRLVMAGAYLGTVVALLALGGVQGELPPAAVACFAVGAFVLGAQTLLYGLAPSFYSTAVRGTGVGAAVAAGRLGSVIGPLLAGTLIGAGGDAVSVLRSIVPIVLVAGITAMMLLWRNRELD